MLKHYLQESNLGVKSPHFFVFLVRTLIDNKLLAHDLHAYGFYIMDDFLPVDHCASLRHMAQEMHQNGLFRNAKIGPTVGVQRNNAIRTDEICWLDEHSPEPAVRAYLQQAMRVATVLNQFLFLGLIEFETHFAVYQPGAFYKKHVDQFATKKTRKISCVYYLNEDWQDEFGGELKLYNKEDQLIQRVSPQPNRFICFNSELPHEVCLTHKPRYSITGWMKTRPLA